LLDTARPFELDASAPSPYPLAARSLAMFRTRPTEEPESERISSELAHKLMRARPR
jgi:hypothetical protein